MLVIPLIFFALSLGIKPSLDTWKKGAVKKSLSTSPPKDNGTTQQLLTLPTLWMLPKPCQESANLGLGLWATSLPKLASELNGLTQLSKKKIQALVGAHSMIICWKTFSQDSLHSVSFWSIVDRLDLVLVENRGQTLLLCLLACVAWVSESNICNLVRTAKTTGWPWSSSHFWQLLLEDASETENANKIMHLAKREAASNRKENYFLAFLLINVCLETENTFVLCLRIVNIYGLRGEASYIFSEDKNWQIIRMGNNSVMEHNTWRDL